MISVAKFLVLMLLAGIGCSSPETATDSIERKQLFNFDWKFLLGDPAAASEINFDDSGWENLDLPHDWSIEGQIDHNNPSGVQGGYFPTGTGWYRKTFTVPQSWKGKLATIYFEGVYMNSEVFINGTSLGVHPYGYTSFYYDLTPFLEYGKENSIAVRVDNSEQRNCRWYSGSGIYRHTWLLLTDPVHIGQWGVAATTPIVSDSIAEVEIRTTVFNESGSDNEIVIESGLLDKNNLIAGKDEMVINIPANDSKEVVQRIQIRDPFLWSPESPDLYQLDISLKQNTQTLDHYQTSIGVRSINFSVAEGFVLNGKKVILNGGCVHHDNGSLGAKAFDRAEERKVELLKAAGFNAVRTSHNPPAEAFLEACDRLGMLVIDEAFDGWRTAKEPEAPHDYSKYFDLWWERDLQSMLLRDRNHPSIIMWSIGNEIIERTEPQAVETAKMLAGSVRKTDPTRPVTSAMTTWNQGWEIFDSLMAAHDVCGYNYQLFQAESDHERVPSRIIVNTESYPNNAFNIWNLVDQHSYIIGDFVWTAMDYLGESSIGRYYYPGEADGEHYQADFFPWHGAYCGDIDLTGWRKPISHYRDLLYNNREPLYMAVREPNPDNGVIKLTSWAVWPTWESWTWPGHEGKNIEVDVYSKYPSVRLYLNDKLVGEQLTGRDQEYKTTFKIQFTPGILKAVAVDNNQEKEAVTLETAGKSTKLKLTPDRSIISANGQDLSYVIVEVTDEDGVRQPNDASQLTFDVEGPATIIGVDNANLKNTDKYVGNQRNAWKGRAMVVLKSSREAGEIKLTVSAPGLTENHVVISSVNN